MFSEEVMREIKAQAARIGVEAAALLVVASVESGGKVFAIVEGRREPLIRFEGHYFDRRLSPGNRAIARAAGLASPKAGGVVNPGTQAGRWRLLARAAAIDRKAAYESVSWGIGQVMGAHWAWLGYPNVEALVDEARSGAAGQVRLMANYIEKAGLVGALQRRDWAGFARGYNGPLYRRHDYDTRLKAAYERYRKDPSAARLASPTSSRSQLRKGAGGEAVRDLQRKLTALGYALRVDGTYGPATVEAVRRFQKEHGLSVDGITGERTYAAIEASLGSGGLGRLCSWLKSLLVRWLWLQTKARSMD